ncbi:uncharacterized protein TNCV_1335451 [Trichonephila clavipes]|nr:uncharacterized protein TNCV_1335451 [Trichonephila clavipes]
MDVPLRTAYSQAGRCGMQPKAKQSSRAGAAKAVKSHRGALNNCLLCKIARAKCDKQIEIPLPAERLTPCKPFDTTGIDFAGPVWDRGTNSPKKSYIALFTCSTNRALHVDLVSDLTTNRFLMAFRRFVGQCGLSHTIYMDSATTFQAANKELIFGILCHLKMLNSFMLKMVFGGNSLWHARLGRGNWGDDEEALTLCHFLTGPKLTKIPSGPELTDRRLTQKQDLLDQFGKKWLKEGVITIKHLPPSAWCLKLFQDPNWRGCLVARRRQTPTHVEKGTCRGVNPWSRQGSSYLCSAQ